MKQPETILAAGMQVRTNDDLAMGMVGVRRPGVAAKIVSAAPGMIDVYTLEHEDGTRGAYCFDEFELKTNDINCAENEPVVIQGLNVPQGGETAVAIAWTNTITPDCVVELLCTTEYGDIGGVGCVALDLAGITKLRQVLDKAETAWKARMVPPPVVIKTAQEAYALVGAGNELVAMAVQAGAFRAPQIVFSYEAEVVVPRPSGNPAFGQYSLALDAINKAIGYDPSVDDNQSTALEVHRQFARAHRQRVTIDVYADGKYKIRGVQ